MRLPDPSESPPRHCYAGSSNLSFRRPIGRRAGPPFGQAIARLQQGTSAAATTLLKTMIDPSTPASVKVRAAEAIFNHAAKAIEIEDIEARARIGVETDGVIDDGFEPKFARGTQGGADQVAFCLVGCEFRVVGDQTVVPLVIENNACGSGAFEASSSLSGS
jgi:hypothetical protein